ncbi:MAG: FHA domain-containing protein [Anaerolineae bacterium]|jgi:hypothetical protein|nr:FHA domain-containing protein [Anaerolineae bacterium]
MTDINIRLQLPDIPEAETQIEVDDLDLTVGQLKTGILQHLDRKDPSEDYAIWLDYGVRALPEERKLKGIPNLSEVFLVFGHHSSCPNPPLVRTAYTLDEVRNCYELDTVGQKQPYSKAKLYERYRKGFYTTHDISSRASIIGREVYEHALRWPNLSRLELPEANYLDKLNRRYTAISREHLLLLIRDNKGSDEFLVARLADTNPTYLNRQAMEEGAISPGGKRISLTFYPIQHGDLIYLVDLPDQKDHFVMQFICPNRV